MQPTLHAREGEAIPLEIQMPVMDLQQEARGVEARRQAAVAPAADQEVDPQELSRAAHRRAVESAA
jgi:hypothetical protein